VDCQSRRIRLVNYLPRPIQTPRRRQPADIPTRISRNSDVTLIGRRQEVVLLRFGMAVRIIERRRRILEGMKLTTLVGHVGEDKGHGTADGFFAIRDDAGDRSLPGFQHLFDFLLQGRQVALRATEQRTRQQDFFGEAVAPDPEHLMPDIGLQAIERQDHVTLLLQPGFDAVVSQKGRIRQKRLPEPLLKIKIQKLLRRS
jgi:hypothetical protein